MSLSLIALTTTKSNLNFARPFSYEITIANIDNERTSMKHDIIVVRTDTKLENYGKDETFIFNKRILNFIESKNGWNPENTLIVLVVRVT